jgi:hypothetical protein
MTECLTAALAWDALLGLTVARRPLADGKPFLLQSLEESFWPRDATPAAFDP